VLRYAFESGSCAELFEGDIVAEIKLLLNKLRENPPEQERDLIVEQIEEYIQKLLGFMYESLRED